MVLFDSEGKLKQYENVNQIIEEFYKVRLQYYKNRKQNMIEQLEKQLDTLSNKVKFILEVVNETLTIRKRKKVDVLKELKTKGYTLQEKKKKKVVAVADAATLVPAPAPLVLAAAAAAAAFLVAVAIQPPHPPRFPLPIHQPYHPHTQPRTAHHRHQRQCWHA
jgi:hypothetical protein